MDEELQEDMKVMQKELARTQAVLGNLIGCLQAELGDHLAARLLERLAGS